MKTQFTFSGSLPEHSSTYVTRAADGELYDALIAGEFCYVLNSRQTGKSSLRLRTMRRLREEAQIACAFIDLSYHAASLATPEQWFVGLIGDLADSFRLDFELEDWWEAQGLRSPDGAISTVY